MCRLKPKLQFSKFIELDVCGRPLFANPVTYIVTYIRFSISDYIFSSGGQIVELITFWLVILGLSYMVVLEHSKKQRALVNYVGKNFYEPSPSKMQ